LIWEYPRQTPTGEQTHLVESMDIVDGLIARHLVCWGWVGFKKLHAAANNTPPHRLIAGTLDAVRAPSRQTPH
jgi:hypothetical protein